MKAACEILSEVEFDAAIAPRTTVKQIKDFRDKVKPEFQEVLCEKCGRTGTAFSWDKKPVVDQAKAVGPPYTTFYFQAYAMPNLQVHATLASAFQHYDTVTEAERREQQRRDADGALASAWAVLLTVIRCQNNFFSLGLETEIAACEKDWGELWATGERERYREQQITDESAGDQPREKDDSQEGRQEAGGGEEEAEPEAGSGVNRK